MASALAPRSQVAGGAVGGARCAAISGGGSTYRAWLDGVEAACNRERALEDAGIGVFEGDEDDRCFVTCGEGGWADGGECPF